ncbi:MAG: glutamyl-tRNA reductase [Rhodothermaceae bacterium]|nr:glutamyl-tRNA reductase [Rhodothermaceae bacterium]
MSSISKHITDQYIVIGVNHHRASVPVREIFSITGEGRLQLIRDAEIMGVPAVIILSTCNRTEILARNIQPDALIDLLIRHSRGSRKQFDDSGFVMKGISAIRHFFRVATGLEAQILGDLQIIRQVKEAYEISAEMDMVDRFTHRLMQAVFRTHKRSRNETSLGIGAATTAYAAVQLARRRMKSLKGKKILLVGAGKIGKVTCKNLMSLGAGEVVVINRNQERADKLSERFQVTVEPFEKMAERCAWADLVIVATSADEPVIDASHLSGWITNGSHKVLVDLSVPRNIDPEVELIEGIELINMDMLNDKTDSTFRERQANIPLVEAIIDEELDVFYNWVRDQRVVPTIRALSDKLDAIGATELERIRKKIPDETMPQVEQLTRRIMKKIMAHSIEHLRESHDRHDEAADMLNTLFKLEPERSVD